jgi:phosphoribosylanthranilate isomerase
VSPGAPRIKICGLMRESDAQLAVELGATAVGFVLWSGSPRAVDAAIAGAIVRRLPPGVVSVGVFVNRSIAEVVQSVEAAGLSAVQLHGDEDAAYMERMPRPVIKAISLERGDGEIERLPEGVVPLLDVHDPVRRGGTGRVIDWGRAASAARGRRVILSGGLTPDNVAAAIATVQPWAVDVSSGVEERPGVKDPARMRAFFEAVRAAVPD